MLTSFALGQIYMSHISTECKHTHTHIHAHTHTHSLSLSPPYSLRITHPAVTICGKNDCKKARETRNIDGWGTKSPDIIIQWNIHKSYY